MNTNWNYSLYWTIRITRNCQVIFEKSAFVLCVKNQASNDAHAEMIFAIEVMSIKKKTLDGASIFCKHLVSSEREREIDQIKFQLCPVIFLEYSSLVNVGKPSFAGLKKQRLFKFTWIGLYCLLFQFLQRGFSRPFFECCCFLHRVCVPRQNILPILLWTA